VAKLEKLNAIAAMIAPPALIPIVVAKRYINIPPSIGWRMTRSAHAYICGKRK